MIAIVKKKTMAPNTKNDLILTIMAESKFPCTQLTSILASNSQAIHNFNRTYSSHTTVKACRAIWASSNFNSILRILGLALFKWGPIKDTNFNQFPRKIKCTITKGFRSSRRLSDIGRRHSSLLKSILDSSRTCKMRTWVAVQTHSRANSVTFQGPKDTTRNEKDMNEV